jgi:hypothetical protein
MLICPTAAAFNLQSIDELQTVVSERCLKTDQLGAIFAARDNMYGAWMKMQAVFESNKSQSGGNTSRASGVGLFKMRPSLTLSPIPSVFSSGTASAPAADAAGSGPAATAAAAGSSAFAAAAASGTFDPFEEMATSSRQSDSSRVIAGSPVEDATAAGPAPPAVTPEVVLAATRTSQDEQAASAAAAAAVTTADLAAVLQGQFQLREAVAQLSEQLAVLQTQQPPSAASTPPAQPEAVIKPEERRPARSDSAAFLLMVQHELAGVAVRVAEINSKVDEQSSQVQAAAATATRAMAAAVAAAAAGRASPSRSRRASRSISIGTAGTAQPTEAELAAGTLLDLQRSIATLQEKVEQLQQQSNAAGSADPTCEGDQQQDGCSASPPDALRAASTAGVLHAPLSVVVQLQQELAAIREAQVSKEQFAAVVRMVRDLKDPAAETAAEDVQQQLAGLQAKVAAAAEGRQQAVMAVEAALQQQDERLVAAEFSIESLLQRLEVTAAASVEAMDALIAEQQLQQHGNTLASQQQQEFAAELAALQDSLQQQAAAVETVGASANAAQHQAGELSIRVGSMQEEQAKLSVCMDDLAAKVASAVNAAASAATMPRRIGSEDAAGGSGFGEMVAGLANLKGCLDSQCQAVAALQQRLDAQEEAVAELAAAALARAEAAAVVLEGIEGAAGPTGAAAEDVDGAAGKAASSALLRSASSKCSIAMKADVAEAAAELRGTLEQLQAKLSEMEHKMQQHEQSRQQPETICPVLLSLPSSRRSVSGSGCISDAAAAPATAGTTAAIISSLSASRRVSKVSSIAAADAIELTAAAADEAAVAVAGLMSVVHQILTELKKRVEALEATAATTAATAASNATASATAVITAPMMHSNALFVPGASVAAGASVPATPSSKAGAGPRRGAAWLAASGEAASLAELQDIVERLQQDVARIAMDSSSHTAELNSLRGDVGAAAAAAAVAAAAASAVPAAGTRPASCEPPASATGVFMPDVADVAAEAAAATAAADAQQAAAEVQKVMQALSQEVLQLQVQLGSRVKEHALTETADQSAAARDAAVFELQNDVSAIKAQIQQASSNSSTTADEQLVRLAAQVQALELQVHLGAATAAASVVSDALPASCSVDGLDELRAEIAQVKQQVLAAAAAGASAAQAQASLQAAVQALQDQLAWASSSAAAAASAAATEAVEEVKEQLEDLQGQVVRAVALSRSTTGLAAHMQAAAATAGANGEAAAAAVQPLVCRSGLSFNDLAVAPSPSSRAIVQQLFTNVASEIAPAAAGDTAEGNSWFNPMFEDAQQQKQQQAQATPAEGGFGSLVGSPEAAVVGTEGFSDQQLLGAQLALLSPAHQVEFLGKLARVVSSHATRLLATYREDAALAGQLQQVQERLSTFVSTSSSAAAAVSRAVRSSDASSARLSVSSSISRRSVGALPAGVEAVGSASPGLAAGEVLLGILDQVAALRAIGSATHPAIGHALQQHEAQIAALADAQQQLQLALASVSAGSSSGSSLTQDGKAGDAATAELPAAVAEASNSTPASAAPGVGVEQHEGEYGQRLSALESRLGSGLRVLAGLRDRLSPLQEVADASQCMMRELQVAHGLVLQRLEALEGLAAAGLGQAGSGTDAQEGAANGGALAMAGSLRKLQVRGRQQVTACLQQQQYALQSRHDDSSILLLAGVDMLC